MNLHSVWVVFVLGSLALIIAGGVLQMQLTSSKSDPENLALLSASFSLWFGTLGIVPIVIIAALTLVFIQMNFGIRYQLQKTNRGIKSFLSQLLLRVTPAVTWMQQYFPAMAT